MSPVRCGVAGGSAVLSSLSHRGLWPSCAGDVWIVRLRVPNSDSIPPVGNKLNLPVFFHPMEEVYRGYRISLEDRGLYLRVYVSPIYPWLPILHSSYFDSKGTREQALAEAYRKVDRLVDWKPD